jgi:hypothetical protein
MKRVVKKETQKEAPADPRTAGVFIRRNEPGESLGRATHANLLRVKTKEGRQKDATSPLKNDCRMEL